MSILLWNVWNLPSWLTDNKSKTRAQQISPLLNDFDIVVLNEAFVNHKALLSSVTHQYLYIPPRPWTCIFSSGLLFLSRYPILESGYEKFENRSGVDRFAGKGVGHILVDLAAQGRNYGSLRVLGTHMQASYGGSAQAARMSQATQIGHVIKKLTYDCLPEMTGPANGVSRPSRTVLLGDMNIGPRNCEDSTYSQHYYDEEDADKRTSAYALLQKCSNLHDISSFQNQNRDEFEYKNEICRILVSSDVIPCHNMSYELQPYTDGGNRLSDTKALCLRMVLSSSQ